MVYVKEVLFNKVKIRHLKLSYHVLHKSFVYHQLKNNAKITGYIESNLTLNTSSKLQNWLTTK